MEIPKIMDIGKYQFKNYRMLTEKEQKIALAFRNKNRDWMINKDIIQIEAHKKWINTLQHNSSIIYYLVFKDNIPFMSVDFHNIDFKKKEAYWGYFLGKENYKSEVLKIQKIVIDIAFSKLRLDKLICITDIDNHVINIHKFFGFMEDKVIKIEGKDFLRMYLLNIKRKKSFNLRGATKSDWEVLLEWRNDKITRHNSFNFDFVSVSEHKEYINNTIVNPNRKLFILEYNAIPVGSIREDRLKKDEFKLSYTISPMYRGKKIGQIMMSLYLIDKKGSFLCEVKEENIPSIKMIEKMGFKIFNTEKRVNFYKLNQS